MKLRHLVLFVLACAGLFIYAQEAKNLVLNGNFAEVFDERPALWAYPLQEYVKIHPDGGPDNRPYMEVIGNPDRKFENIIRQKGMTLVPGEEYLLSAMIKTKDFSAVNGSLIITDPGWYHSSGINHFPATTDGWVKVEQRIQPPSKDTTFNIVVLSIAQKGYFAITDVKLIPLTSKAVIESRSTTTSIPLGINRLCPLSPSFNEVPIRSPFISFKWFGKDKAVRQAALNAWASDASCGFIGPKAAVKNGEVFTLNLNGCPAGLRTMKITVADQASGAVVHEEEFLVNLRDIPLDSEATVGRRLNNLTVELVNQKVAANGQAEFVLAHDRWMYFTVKNSAKADFTMKLDGKVIDDKATGLPEAFRLVEAGRHAFTVDCGGTLIARTIPELFTCAVCEGPRVTEFPEYDWEFAKKWALPAVTHCNRGPKKEPWLKEAHDSGRIWTGNLGATNPPSVEVMHRRLDGTMPHLGKADGVTADELFYVSPEMDNYTQALKTNGYDRNKLIYTWACYVPTIQSTHTDFIATALNASHGRGRIMREGYYGANTLDEKDAYKKVYDDVVSYFKASEAFFPGFMRRSGMVFGNFNQINVITLEHYPQVDYKYYLDMQLSILANDPVFKELGLTGYWGTHYTDEEMYRWSHALLRHYVVEGQTEMLSKKYGFSYLPGHIQNNDFADGLKGWTVKAAAEGSVSADTFAELSRRNQDRWGGAGNIGNTFCKVKAVEGKPNVISQVARNLVPGRQYMLLFIAGDYDDLKAQKFNPREYGLNVSIDGARIDESFIFIDKREKGNYAQNHNIARQNLYRYVFTPTGTEVTLTFTDEKAKPGQTHFFNYVQVKPFFPKKAY